MRTSLPTPSGRPWLSFAAGNNDHGPRSSRRASQRIRPQRSDPFRCNRKIRVSGSDLPAAVRSFYIGFASFSRRCNTLSEPLNPARKSSIAVLLPRMVRNSTSRHSCESNCGGRTLDCAGNQPSSRQNTKVSPHLPSCFIVTSGSRRQSPFWWIGKAKPCVSN